MSGSRCKALRRFFKAQTGTAPAQTFWKEIAGGWRYKQSEWRKLKKKYLEGKRQGKEMGE
jgi:hypothetical protein